MRIEDCGEEAYDGSQIAPLWAFKEKGIQGDSIVFFQGPMKVSKDALVDIEDLRMSVDEFPITSQQALHFIVEHFDDQGLRLAYHRQRILVNVVKERIIDESGVHIKRKGSDLYFGEKKLSVSVATASVSSSKIHLGLNIVGKGVPRGVKATGLKDIGIRNITALARSIAEVYDKEIKGIQGDISKTRVY